MRGRLTVILVRHGAVNNPKGVLYFRNTELELSSKGRTQMSKLAEKLKEMNVKPSTIHTSTHIRAVESAKVIAGKFPGVPIVREEDLRDVDAPTLKEKTPAWVARKLILGKDIFSELEKKRDMESRDAVARRMLQFLKRASLKYGGRTLIVIGHADPIFFTRYRLKNPDRALPSRLAIPTLLSYPKIGKAFRIVLDKKLGLVEETQIN